MGNSITNSDAFAEALGHALITRANAGRRATDLAHRKGRQPRYEPRVGDWVQWGSLYGKVMGRDSRVPGAVLVQLHSPDGEADPELQSLQPWAVTFVGREVPDAVRQERGAA